MDFDVVGVGALNLDLIVDVDDIPDHLRTAVQEGFNSDRERITTEFGDWLGSVRRIPRKSQITAAQGGSAFNTVHALAAMNVGLRLGYVGVSSPRPQELRGLRPELDLPDARSILRELAIDGGGVLDGEAPGGLSISLVEGNIRSLRTYVDLRAGAILEAQTARLASYMARAGHLHITSIAGDVGATAIADAVESALTESPDMTVTVDPGELWVGYLKSAAPAAEGVRRLLALADGVFVNAEEMASLTGDTSRQAAETFLANLRLGKKRTLIFLKGVEEATAFVFDQSSVTAVTAPQRVLPPTAIADTTGAGDVFAAGVLAGWLSNSGQLAGSMAVGLSAARRKMQHLGDAGYISLAQAVNRLDVSSNRRVFISHSFDDREVAELLVELLERIGVPERNIFCASLASNAPRPGDYLDPKIRNAIEMSSLVILLLSDSFMKSEYCQYEVGAAWALKVPQFPIGLPSANFGKMSSILRDHLIADITKAPTFGSLYDVLTSKGLLDPSKHSSRTRWEDLLSAFLRRTELLIRSR